MEPLYKDFFKQYKWKLNSSDKQFGSDADLYLECLSKDKNKSYMLIDDGNVDLEGNVYHIYTLPGLRGKIFEGYVETCEEFKIVMKVLGYK